jgi:hypothetical protein
VEWAIKGERITKPDAVVNWDRSARRALFAVRFLLRR